MQIPGYQIKRHIAKGGYSSVFLAVQQSLGRRVALKILKPFDDPGQTTRFLEEGRIIASLNHRNIITIYDVGGCGNWHYIAMEYLGGGSLADRIRQGNPPAACLDLLETIAGCFDFVHRRGIVHRDVKPANILFHDDGTPKITDFGIAKQLTQDQDLTMDGSALGSPYYLSPEQAECKTLDGRSDIYGLGVIFYEMLTGEKPFRGESHIETVMAHLTQPVPLLPAEHSAYQELLERMIAKDPEERFGSAAELLGFVRALRRLARRSDSALQTSVSRGLPGAPGEKGPSSPEVGSPHGRGIARRGSARPPGVAVGALVLATLAGMTLYDRWQAAPEIDAAPLTGGPGGGGVSTPANGAPTPAPPRPETAVEAVMAQPGPAPEGPSPAALSAAADAAAPPSPQTAASEAQQPPPGPWPLRGGAVMIQSLAQTAEDTRVAATPVPGEAPRGAPPGAPDRRFAAAATQPAGIGPAPTDREAEGVTADASGRQIDRWLQLADVAIREYRLTVPEEDSAYFFYRQILERAPGHEQADRGMSRIADRYAGLVSGALEEENWGRARRYLDRGLMVKPGHERLSALEKKIDARNREARAAAGKTPVIEPVQRLFSRVRSFFAQPPREWTNDLLDH